MSRFLTPRIATLIIIALILGIIAAGAGIYRVQTTVRGPMTVVERNFQDASVKVKANPKDYKARIALAKAMGAVGKYGAAQAQLRYASKLKSNDPEPYMVSGIIYRMAGNDKKAIEAHKKAISMPNGMGEIYLQSYFELGEIYTAAKDYKKAIKSYRKAQNYGPELLYIAEAVAKALEQSGRLKSALAEYTMMLPMDPDNKQYQKAYLRIEEKIEAKRTKAKKAKK